MSLPVTFSEAGEWRETDGVPVVDMYLASPLVDDVLRFGQEEASKRPHTQAGLERLLSPRTLSGPDQTLIAEVLGRCPG